MSKQRRVPWQPVVVLTLLGIALGVSVASGRTGDAVIISVLLALGLLLYGAVAFLDLKHRGRGHHGG